MTDSKSINAIFDEYFVKRKELEEKEKKLLLIEHQLDIDRKNLTEKQQELEKLQSTISTYKKQCDEIIHLEVGEFTFKCTQKTLSKSTYINTLLEKINGNHLYIDRDPDIFKEILLFLRTDILPTKLTEKFKNECQYYGITYHIHNDDSDNENSTILSMMNDTTKKSKNKTKK